MKSFFIASIVSGHGEVQAVPVLLQRILEYSGCDGWLEFNPPIRVKEHSFFNDEEYRVKYLTMAVLKARARNNPLVLVLLDSEDDCPAVLGSLLFDHCKSLFPDANIQVCLAYREFETWFIAAAESLRGICGLADDLTPPSDPEAIRGAKEWLSARMQDKYNEPNDQPGMTAKFSIEQACSIPSFRRLLEKISIFFTSKA